MACLFANRQDLQFVVQVIQALIFSIARCLYINRLYLCACMSREIKVVALEIPLHLALIFYPIRIGVGLGAFRFLVTLHDPALVLRFLI